MTVWFDVTSLVRDRRRSGIQRVQRAILQHWPGPAPLRPCWYDPEAGAMRALPRESESLLWDDGAGGSILTQPFPASSVSGREVVGGFEGRIERVGCRILCAELFDEPARAAYYRGLLGVGTVYWLVFDALPWLRPEWYAAGPATRLMPYLQVIRDMPHVAFISAATKRDYVTRILRRPCPGPVLRLGSDGLGLGRQVFDQERGGGPRRDVVMLGTIEPRKNAAVAMRAARLLWAEGAAFRLILIGMVEHDARDEQALLRELAGEARFVHLEAAPDAAVREALGRARGLLFPSQAEGYGLPAMEALGAGIPVIVAADLPALEGLPVAGQIRLERVDEAAVAGAMRVLLDDREAARLWDEAARLDLPGWQEFGREIAAWIG